MKIFYILLITIISIPLTAQTVGQEYLPNPGVCTTQNTDAGCDTTGVDGSGTLSATNRFGTSAHNGAAYGSVANGDGSPNANAPAYHGNRVYKLFKKGNATDPQFVALDTIVPPGIYTYSIYTRWPVAVDYNESPAKKPFLRIKGHNNTDSNDNSTIVEVVPNNSAGTTKDDWIQTTGEVTIPAASDGSNLKIRFSFGKLGGSNASPTNLDEILLIDYVSLKYKSSTDNDASALKLKGVIDFTVPSAGSDGKAIHLVASEDIADLSVYGIGVANNGGGTDGQEYTFDSGATAAKGDNILVVRSKDAMDSYLDASNIFDQVIIGTSAISQNGNDAIELYYNDEVSETYGDPDVDGTGQDWEYLDSWAFKEGGTWTTGAVDCTDGSTTTWDSSCVYPYAVGKQPASPAQINFSEDWIAAAIKSDEGAVATIIDDPSNSDKGKVLNVVYGGEGSQDWQNAQILIPVGQKKIDLRTTKTVSFDIWTSHDDADANKGKYSGLLKLETPTTGASNASIEKGFVTSGNGWETITVDFTDNYKGDNGGTSNDQFRKIVLFTNYGGGDEAHQVSGGVHKKEDTRVYDNFVYAEGDEVPAPATPITELTVDFETASGFKPYSNIVYADVADGAGEGYNSSGYGSVSKVNEDWWAQIGLDASGPLDLSSKDRGISIMVKGDRQSKLTLKIQDGDDFNNSHEIRPDDFNYTAVGEWQKVIWDLSTYDSNDKGRIVFFFDIQTNKGDTNEALDNFKIDDLKFGSFATLGLADVNLNSAIVIYPNPSDGILNISGVEKVDAIRAFSISGQLIKEAVNTNRLDLSSQRSGLYMIEVQHEGQTTINKLILR